MRSVVMATYQGTRYVQEQVQSILDQLAPCDEIVVCDDASSDDTVQKIRDIDSNQIRLYVNEKRLGYVRNFQKAVHLSKGDLVFFSDQDDVWLPDKVSMITERLAASGCVVSDARVVDEALAVTASSFFKMRDCTKPTFLNVLAKPRFIGATMACTRSYLLTLLPFPPAIPHDFWITLNALWDDQLAIIDQQLILYRRHSATASVSAKQKTRLVTTILTERLALIYHFGVRRLHLTR